MFKRLLTVLIPFLFFSCASIRLDETYKLEVKSDKVSKIKYNDSTYNLPAEIEVYRSSKPLKLVYMTDSIQKKIVVKRILHPNFIYGNILYNTGYLIDLLNQKRFYYGKSIMINLKDSIKVVREPLFDSPKVYAKQFVNQLTKKYITKKGDYDFTFSIPIATNFEMRPLNEGVKKSVGFGFSIGSDYYYKDNKFVSLNLTAFADRFVTYYYFTIDNYEIERQFSSNISLSDNLVYRRFTFGYGLNFSKNSWIFNKKEEFSTFYNETSMSKYNYNLGFIFNSYYKVSQNFYFGFNYRPTLLQIYPTTNYLYQHTFGIDFQFKI